MQVIVLAAGRGTRMRPLTENVPKPMPPVGSEPMAGRVADAAVDAGAERLVFVVGYEGESVREHFGSRYDGVPVTHVEQDELLGTADAVRAAADRVSGRFAVLNGDNVSDAEGRRSRFPSRRAPRRGERRFARVPARVEPARDASSITVRESMTGLSPVRDASRRSCS